MDTERSNFVAVARDSVRVLRARWWLVLACILIAGATAYAYVSQQSPVYEATTKVLLQPQDLGAFLVAGAPTSSDTVRDAATDQELVSAPAVAARVARRLKLTTPPDAVAGAVSASVAGDSNVLSITARDEKANRAAQLANAFATEYIGFRRDTERARIKRALALLRGRIAQLRGGPRQREVLRLSDQAQQLALLASVQTGGAQIVAAAGVPGSPSSPRKTRSVALGALFGALLGLALAFGRDRFDRHVKSEEQIRELIPGIPLLGVIPKSGRGERSAEIGHEAFRSLYASLAFLGSGGAPSSLLFTSAVAGEGKTTTSVNLALVGVEHGHRIVLLEADLRRPALSELLELGRQDRGLATLLNQGGNLADSVQRVAVQASRDKKQPLIALEGELPMVPAGPLPPNPQALLARSSAGELVDEAARDADLVIVDGPPIGVVSDMLPLAQHVEGVVVVLRAGHSRIDQVHRLLEHLGTFGIVPLGLVLVGAPDAGPGYGYGNYGYTA